MRRILEDSGIIAGRILLELVRTRRSLLFWGVFPVLMLLLFGLIYSGTMGQGRAFTTTAPGILIGAALFFSCLSGTVVLIVGERERGTLRRLLLSPLRGSSYVLGLLLANLAVAFGQAALLWGEVLLFGGAFHGSLALGLLIVALSVAIYAGIGFLFGARLARRTEDVNGPIAAFGVPLLVLGGTFFPPSLLPPYLRYAAQLDPIYHMNEALRAVWSRGAGFAEVRLSVLALFLMAAVSLLLGASAYRRLIVTERGA